jgi:hypothetical protein
MSDITIVKGDDWHGLYKDGTLLVEGHKLTYEDIADALGVKITEKECDQEWLEDNGNLPKKLSDVKGLK